MAFIDFMANQTDSSRFGLSNDLIGSPFLLPSFPGPASLLQQHHPDPAPPITNNVCPTCFNSCDIHSGFCPNCHRLPNRLHNSAYVDHQQDISDSFIMSNMLNVVADVLREDTVTETPRPPPPAAVVRCGKCSAHQSSFMFCVQCRETLCMLCISRHNPNHDFTQLDSTSPKPASISPQSSKSYFSDCDSYDDESEEDATKFEYCDIHSKEKIRYFCQPCTALLCYSCISNGHQHHPHTTIKEAYERIKPTINNVSVGLSQKMNHLSIAVESASEMREKIVRKKEEAIEKVQRLFQSYREVLARHEKEVLAQISVLTDLRVKSLAKGKESNERSLNDVRSLQQNLSKVKDAKKKASTVLLYHTIAQQLEYPSNVNYSPVEDDSIIVKANHSNIRESLGSLCVLTTSPYPPLCTAMGEGLFHPRVNQPTTVLVTTVDRMGEPCTEGGQQVVVTLKPVVGSTLKVEVRDNHNGSYCLSFRPKVKGEHQLCINICGHPIQGSPFKLDVDGGRVYGYDGVPTNIFGSEGNKPGQFCRPWGIACDQKGNIIVGDRSNHRVQVFDSDGVLKTVFGSEGTGNGQFNRPAGVATTREGHIVVADKDNHRLQVFKIDGTYLFKFGSKGGNDGQMIYPYDVAVNQVDGRIAVTDTGNHRLLIFSCDGVLLGKFGFKGYLCGHFDSPRGIAFNKAGHLIVSDFNVHHILIIHPEGTTARILGSQGSGDGQFMRPQGVAVDRKGKFVIADTRNNRIMVMEPSGEFVAKFGTPGSGRGQLDRPTSVCVLPDERVAVVDFGNSRIQIF